MDLEDIGRVFDVVGGSPTTISLCQMKSHCCECVSLCHQVSQFKTAVPATWFHVVSRVTSCQTCGAERTRTTFSQGHSSRRHLLQNVAPQLPKVVKPNCDVRRTREVILLERARRACQYASNLSQTWHGFHPGMTRLLRLRACQTSRSTPLSSHHCHQTGQSHATRASDAGLCSTLNAS